MAITAGQDSAPGSAAIIMTRYIIAGGTCNGR